MQQRGESDAGGRPDPLDLLAPALSPGSSGFHKLPVSLCNPFDTGLDSAKATKLSQYHSQQVTRGTLIPLHRLPP